MNETTLTPELLYRLINRNEALSEKDMMLIIHSIRENLKTTIEETTAIHSEVSANDEDKEKLAILRLSDWGLQVLIHHLANEV